MHPIQRFLDILTKKANGITVTPEEQAVLTEWYEDFQIMEQFDTEASWEKCKQYWAEEAKTNPDAAETNDNVTKLE